MAAASPPAIPIPPTGPRSALSSNEGSISYSLYLDADTYNLSFLAAQRANQQTQNPANRGAVRRRARRLGSRPPAPRYTLYDTSNFTVPAGVHTIKFLGMSPPAGESTALHRPGDPRDGGKLLQQRQFRGPGLGRRRPTRSSPAVPAGSSRATAGLSTNNSGFTTGSANAPDGNQVAFIKNNASISQSVYFDAGTYNISFLATQRFNYQTENQQIEVLVNGAEVALVTPPTSTTNTDLHVLQHHVHSLPDCELHACGRHVRRRIPRHVQRRQHGLHRRRHDQHRLRHQ